MAARLECPYCNEPAMSVMGKVFLFATRKCECCGERLTVPRVAAMLFVPIGILMFLSGWGILYGGPVVSDFAIISLLAVAYFIYIMWVPLVPKEESPEWGEERRWQLMQSFFMLIGSALIAVPLWFLLTHDFHTAGPAETAEVPGHKADVISLAWSPNGMTLASGSSDLTIKLWDPDGRMLRSLDNGDGVLCLAWSPDGKRLASGGGSGSDVGGYAIKLWDVSSGQLLRKMKDNGRAVSLAWNPDGSTLASADFNTAVELWDPNGGKLLRTLSGPGSSADWVTWSPDGRVLATSDQDAIRLWEAGSGRQLRRPPVHARSLHAVVWSPDSKGLTIFSSTRFDVWDVSTVRLLESRDCCRGAEHEVWNLDSGRHSHRHDLDVAVAAWSPDGKLLATDGAIDERAHVKLWNPDNGQVVRTLSGHAGEIGSLAWSPDGKILASGSADHTIKLWSISEGRLVSTLGHHGPERIVVCPDGSVLNCEVRSIEEKKSGE